MPATSAPVAAALAVMVALPAGPCPAVNKRGFRPGAVVAYSTAPSPDGTPFPMMFIPCVDRAFDEWTRANARTGLRVMFVPGTGGIEVRMDKPGGLVLPTGAGGAWSGPRLGADGYLERADIWLTADRSLIDDCAGVTKVVLHELGHLHGLADRVSARGRSVMNRAVRRNDKGHRLPLGPTPCDAARAHAASMAVSPEPPTPAPSPRTRPSRPRPVGG